jgi:imidazolonepropionase
LHAAKRAGLDVRAHVGQFRDLGGAELVAELGGLSVDHLEHVSDAGIAALARAGTVAVMLPGACVQLRLPVPPVEKLRAAGVTLAVASDLNPGSSFCETLPIQMWLATTHYGMTVDEAWLGVTRHAATALGLPIVVGVLGAGACADVVVWNCERPAEVPYRYGSSLVDRVFVRGIDKTSK